MSRPQFSATPTQKIDIPLPASKGLNYEDLEYEMEYTMSPNMKNMMYRNGTFGKRYGQTLVKSLANIHNVAYYNGKMIIHAGTKVYKEDVEIGSNVANKKGLFFNFNNFLYYLCDKYYQYDGTWAEVSPHIPVVAINIEAGSKNGDIVNDYNLIGSGFINKCNGGGTLYYLSDDSLDNTTPIVKVDGVTVTNFTYDKDAGTITFDNNTNSGVNNIEITAYKTVVGNFNKIVNSSYGTNFGGQNESRMFLANGNTYYYSDVFDATYFPETQYGQLGEQNITGFGKQYNILVIFKENEMYSLQYYVQTDPIQDREIGKGAFMTQLINGDIGCNCPNSIQLIENQLVWLNSKYGVCTLISSTIKDERNVQVISKNINGGIRQLGLLNHSKNVTNVCSTDFEGKYIVTLNNVSYVWDYLISSYKNPAWFFFDNTNVINYLNDGYFYTTEGICKYDNTFNDFGDSIEAYYQTPLIQFTNRGFVVNYLKTLRNLYIQSRSDTSSTVEIEYITEDNPIGELDPEPIHITGRLWDNFRWDDFIWSMGFGQVYRRKCNLKKIQMAGIKFSNNELNKDLSISHLTLEYQVLRTVK